MIMDRIKSQSQIGLRLSDACVEFAEAMEAALRETATVPVKDEEYQFMDTSAGSVWYYGTAQTTPTTTCSWSQYTGISSEISGSYARGPCCDDFGSNVWKLMRRSTSSTGTEAYCGPNITATHSAANDSAGHAEPIPSLFANSKVFLSCDTIPEDCRAVISVTGCARSSERRLPCKIPNCKNDVSVCREYYRKRKLCPACSQEPQVFYEGEWKRYCQQCSQLHPVDDFDGRKRSCRTKLGRHRARATANKQRKDSSSLENSSRESTLHGADMRDTASG